MLRTTHLFVCAALTVSAVSYATAASAQPKWEDVLPHVKLKCAQEDPDDYALQAYCISHQHEGWLAVQGADTSDSPPPASQPLTQVAPDGRAGPAGASQSAFIALLNKYAASYNSSLNDMQKGALRPERGRQLCQMMPSVAVQNWHGTVYDLSANNDGNGVIEIAIGDNVYVRTMNNAFSDISYGTLIPFGTRLFDQAPI